MAHDEFDLYDTIIRDTNELSNRRRQLDSLYVTLITFILTGEAYLAFYSYSHALDNWVVAGAAGTMSLVGLIVTTRWNGGQRKMYKLLTHRYTFLRELEQKDELKKLGATLFTTEWDKVYNQHDSGGAVGSATFGLQLTFAAIFFFIPIAFATANLSGPIVALLNSLHP